MFKSLNESVKLKGKNIITRIEKDLPYWNKYFNYPSSLENLKKHTLMEISKIDWSGISGKDANESYFSNVFLNKLRLKCKSSDIKTYVEGGKHCMLSSEYTPIIEKLIMELYPPHLEHSWELGSLKPELPTIFIPLEIWQRKGEAYSDPNAGEAVAFPAMFDFLHEDKANIIYFAYGIPHPNWYEHYLKNKSKVWRAINSLGDILCVDNKIDSSFIPLSIKINKSNNKKF